MKLSLICPACSRPIAHAHRTEELLTCSSCGSQFGVVHGKLSKRASIYETLLYLTAQLPRFYKRHYTLQITTPDRTLRQLQFSIPGKLDQVPVHSGDIVSVLYTMRGYMMQKLVAIMNHTTGKSYVLPTPIPSPNHLTPMLITAGTGLMLGAYWLGASVFLAATVTAIGILAYVKVTNTAQFSNPPLHLQGQEGTRLLADQQMIHQHRKIDQRIGEIEHETQANRMLLGQLENLKQKMSRLDDRLYSARIYRIHSAMNLLEQQITNNHRLIREYRHTMKMIDIEVETSWIADQLPEGDTFLRTIIRKLEELRAIEDQNQSIKLQLAAYDEMRGRQSPC